MNQFCEINVVFTPDLFRSLSAALGIRWPAWYEQVVSALLETPVRYGERWLPGGFLFANPQVVFEHTTAYRTGQCRMRRETGAGSFEDAPWPDHFVVVGHCGDGRIVIDASSADPRFLNLYKEDYTLQPFLDLVELGKTPLEFAQLLREGDAHSDP